MQRLFSFMLCPSIYSVSWSGSKKGHCPSLSYDEALNEAGIPTIISYCEDICDKVFNAALGNKDNKLLTEANKYLLLAESSVRTVNNGPSFFPSIYGPSATRAGHKSMEKNEDP